MADPLVQAVVRVYDDFADPTLAEILAVLARTRNDLDTPRAAALPGLVERLARKRLADGLASPAPATARPRTNTPPNPAGETGSSASGAPRLREPVAHRASLDEARA